MGFSFSVCIIAKNESEHIGRCIEAIRPLVGYFKGSDIVVIDTGSEDDTINIAKSLGAKVDELEWIGDFSFSRNYAADRADNDYILSVDCDEILLGYSNEVADEFAKLALRNVSKIGMSEIISMHEENGETNRSSTRIGRFYNKKYYKYCGQIHENIRPVCDKDRVEGYFNLPFSFDHKGYDTPELRRKKAVRNRELLEKELKTNYGDPYLMYQIGKCDYALGEYDAAIRIFEDALSQELNCSISYVQSMIVSYGYCLIEKKAYPYALKLEKYMKVLSHNADFMFVIGLIHMNNAMFDRAIDDFLCSTKADTCEVDGTNSYKAFYNIGVIYDVIGNKEKALFYYSKCGDYDKAKARIDALMHNSGS